MGGNTSGHPYVFTDKCYGACVKSPIAEELAGPSTLKPYKPSGILCLAHQVAICEPARWYTYAVASAARLPGRATATTMLPSRLPNTTHAA